VNERVSCSTLVRAMTRSLMPCAAACALVGFANASSLSPEARRDLELRPGVVQIFIPLKGSIPELGVTCPEGAGVLGSGFLFRPDGYLITNGHVAQLANMQDADARRAREAAIGACLMSAVQDKFAAQRRQRGQPAMTPAERQQLNSLVAQYLRDGKIAIEAARATVRVCLDSRRCFNGEIKAYSEPFVDTPQPGKDVAIIKIDGYNLPTVPLGDSDPVNVNDPVYVIGYPGDARVSAVSALIATSTDGRISAVKRLDNPDIPVLQTTAIINPGNSGGPAFDAQGRVIGIATFKSGSSYNYLVPINVAEEFVRQAGVEPQRGAFDELWEKALTAYADGRWASARKLLHDVLKIMPQQPEAERLEREAAAQEKAEGVWGWLIDSLGAAGVTATGFGIAALVSAAVWLVARMNRTAKPTTTADGHDKTLMRKSNITPGRPGQRTPPATLPNPTEPQQSTTGSNLAATRLERFGTLEVISGPLAGKRFAIPEGGLVLGRDPARCAIVLPIDSISKEHAWVVPVDNQVVIIDRGSANGTYVNSTDSARVDQAPLRSGDRIYLGKSNPSVLAYLQ
jgi:hypothetical protein